VGVCAVVRASVGEGGKMLDGLKEKKLLVFLQTLQFTNYFALQSTI
jgi:hypothetical protein